MELLRKKAEHTVTGSAAKFCFDSPLRIRTNKTKRNKWGTHVYLWQIHFDIWQN